MMEKSEHVERELGRMGGTARIMRLFNSNKDKKVAHNSHIIHEAQIFVFDQKSSIVSDLCY